MTAQGQARKDAYRAKECARREAQDRERKVASNRSWSDFYTKRPDIEHDDFVSDHECAA